MTKQEVSQLDLEKTEEEIRRKQEESFDLGITQPNTQFITSRSDPRAEIEEVLAPPTIEKITHLRDNLGKIYLKVQLSIKRTDVERAKIRSFKIYRKRFTRDEILADDDLNGEPLLDFDQRSYERISRQLKKVGKFSAEKKGIPYVRSSSIPDSILNNNLRDENLRREEARLGKVDQSIKRPGLPSDNTFREVALIDYGSFLASEKRKNVFIQDRRNAELFYEDKKVAYNEAYEYYATSISENGEQSRRSNAVKIRLLNPDPISPPISVISKQVTANQISFSVSIKPDEYVERVLVYRRSEDEVSYSPLILLPNVDNRVRFKDISTKYGKQYSYRIFLESVFGTLSDPYVIDIAATDTKSSPRPRSNTLKIPNFTAIQDQNGSFVKIQISPNDPLVSYYVLTRKDLTIFERKFSSPSKKTTNFGGNGWEDNKFFVKKRRKSSNQLNNTTSLTRKTIGEEINFVDEITQPNHVYSYKVQGFDLYGNPTPPSFRKVKVSSATKVRTPINFQAVILRGSPFRIKLTWSDDNKTSIEQDQDLFTQEQQEIKTQVVYKIQRRKLNSNVYTDFPLTSNEFLIDEVASFDAVQFNGRKTEDIFTVTPDVNSEPENFIDFTSSDLQRPFGFPEFMLNNETYFYRIAAITEDGETSNFSNEIEVSALADLSSPINFAASVANVRSEPIIAKLTWESEASKSRPDFWTIQRKIDEPNSYFEEIGKAYIKTEFFDRDLKLGNTYIYRIKSVDLLERESEFFEERLSI